MNMKMTVSGKVQGVGFRFMTKMTADKMGIQGIVKNLDNGDVYIEATGNSTQLALFIDAIKSSPTPSGRVDTYSIDYDVSLPTYTQFNVTY
ncbi:MAG: acylphosphatase [Vagococcus sp.]